MSAYPEYLLVLNTILPILEQWSERELPEEEGVAALSMAYVKLLRSMNIDDDRILTLIRVTQERMTEIERAEKEMLVRKTLHVVKGGKDE